jgi:hypothetical protein
MYFKKDHVRQMPGATTLCFILMCFCSAMVHGQTLPASLVDGPFGDTKELHIGSSSTQAVDVNGIAARFTGDFDAYPPDSMTVTTPGWFSPAAGNLGVSWEFASDSSYADLEIWDTDSGTYSGYGVFAEFYRTGGIGSLDLDDLLKAPAEGLTIESVRVLRKPASALKVYPNPVNSGESIQLSGLMPDTQVEIAGTDGRIVSRLLSTGTSLKLPNLKPGVYIITNQGDKLEPQVKKLIVY